ncbi:MAG TPA: aromatic ring-hydroxylating dioxygenase subunit alpha [Micromonosporaceae bacterium]|nr:aromatic ring-hydroxylating dioxygenase subunit alpha [Micromonosporaceae bacterium]
MTAAPIEPDGIRAALRAHGESVMLPAAAYLDPDVYAWERRRLFAAAWTCLGRAEELLPAGTTQHAVEVGDVGVLLAVVQGQPRAYANVCRHRGHELLPVGDTSGHRAVVCPYHGWAYGLDGALRTAPNMDGTAEGLDLVELPLETWHGWVFVNATGTAPPFRRYLGGMAELVAPYRPERLVVAARHSYDVAANWKILVENYHECYHCPLIHPELCRVSPPSSGANWDLPGAWVGGEMELRDHAETMSLDGRSRCRPLPGVDPRVVRYLGLFPNLLISAHPDYVMTHRLTPTGPGHTEVECQWLFPQGVDDPSYAVEFWDLTNRQDWAACESVQRGIANPHFRPGPLAAKEDAVYQWVTLIARLYADPTAGLTSALEC